MKKVYSVLVLALLLLITGCSSKTVNYDRTQQREITTQILQQYMLGDSNMDGYSFDIEQGAYICKTLNTEVVHFISPVPNLYIAICKCQLDIGVENELWITHFYRVAYCEGNKHISNVEVFSYDATGW